MKCFSFFLILTLIQNDTGTKATEGFFDGKCIQMPYGKQ